MATFPATLYVALDHAGRMLPFASPDSIMATHGVDPAGVNCGVYTLEGTKTVALGAALTTDLAAFPAPAPQPLPVNLYAQMDVSGKIASLNRSPHHAIDKKFGDGTVGVYQRTKFVTVSKSAVLTDVPPAVKLAVAA